MNKRWFAAAAVLLLMVAACAFGFGTPDDLAKYPVCHNCGMSRKGCAPSRMAVEYLDGTRRAECGLHCLLSDLIDQPGRQPKLIQAADYYDQKLADATKCRWVRYENAASCRGSNVMLAFCADQGADRFIASFGGKKLSYDEALKAAYLDLEAERLKATTK
jgi:nitrous oxide reductase accessory protein NosL